MRIESLQPFEPAVTIAAVLSSPRGAVGEVPHAVAASETIVTTSRVSWRRDMGDSGVGGR